MSLGKKSSERSWGDCVDGTVCTMLFSDLLDFTLSFRHLAFHPSSGNDRFVAAETGSGKTQLSCPSMKTLIINSQRKLS